MFYSINSRNQGGLYPEATTFDLRDEMHAILHGDFINPGIGRPLMIRRIRDRKCACFDAHSGSPLPGCRHCQGEGYLWIETVNIGYIAKNLGSVLSGATAIPNQNQTSAWGTSDENRALAYFEHDAFPNYERYLIPNHPTYDKLYELKVEESGDVVTPYVKVAKWKIRSVTPHQADFGRIAFFELGLDKESI